MLLERKQEVLPIETQERGIAQSAYGRVSGPTFDDAHFAEPFRWTKARPSPTVCVQDLDFATGDQVVPVGFVPLPKNLRAGGKLLLVEFGANRVERLRFQSAEQPRSTEYLS